MSKEADLEVMAAALADKDVQEVVKESLGLIVSKLGGGTSVSDVVADMACDSRLNGNQAFLGALRVAHTVSPVLDAFVAGALARSGERVPQLLEDMAGVLRHKAAQAKCPPVSSEVKQAVHAQRLSPASLMEEFTLVTDGEEEEQDHVHVLPPPPTYQEKLQLKDAIVALPEDKLSEMVAILDPSSSEGDQEVVEMDMDTLDVAKFRRLQAFVSQHSTGSIQAWATGRVQTHQMDEISHQMLSEEEEVGEDVEELVMVETADDRKALACHVWVACSACCVSPIRGKRFVCSVCQTNLCDACEAQGLHAEDHPLFVVRVPGSLPAGLTMETVLGVEEKEESTDMYSQEAELLQVPAEEQGDWGMDSVDALDLVVAKQEQERKDAQQLADTTLLESALEQPQGRVYVPTVDVVEQTTVRDVSLNKQTATLSWRIVNSSPAQLPLSTRLLFLGGDLQPIEELPSGISVRAGASHELFVPVCVPDVPGTHVACFRLASIHKGAVRQFGPRLTAEVRVADSVQRLVPLRPLKEFEPLQPIKHSNTLEEKQPAAPQESGRRRRRRRNRQLRPVPKELRPKARQMLDMGFTNVLAIVDALQRHKTVEAACAALV